MSRAIRCLARLVHGVSTLFLAAPILLGASACFRDWRADEGQNDAQRTAAIRVAIKWIETISGSAPEDAVRPHTRLPLSFVVEDSSTACADTASTDLELVELVRCIRDRAGFAFSEVATGEHSAARAVSAQELPSSVRRRLGTSETESVIVEASASGDGFSVQMWLALSTGEDGAPRVRSVVVLIDFETG